MGEIIIGENNSLWPVHPAFIRVSVYKLELPRLPEYRPGAAPGCLVGGGGGGGIRGASGRELLAPASASYGASCMGYGHRSLYRDRWLWVIQYPVTRAPGSSPVPDPPSAINMIIKGHPPGGGGGGHSHTMTQVIPTRPCPCTGNL